MDYTSSAAITDYLTIKEGVFTVDDFIKYLKLKNVKITKSNALDILRSSNYVFPLVNGEFVTRAGVYTNRWFSIKPTKEEIQKDRLLLGHRCMPFVNPDIAPDEINVVTPLGLITSCSETFSMNLALDLFALFGEGYVLPYIINDKSNKTVPLSSVQYSLPYEITLTCWKLSEIAGRKLHLGDRLLCRVTDWVSSTVEMTLVDTDDDGELTLTSDDIERENWYTSFENGLLESFDRNGPASSIEEQLAFLFLEHQEELCTKNCGSCEEFLSHTKKIGFSAYGVETRIWRNNETVPYVGEWNKEFSGDMLINEMIMTFSPQIIDSYINNSLYEKNKNKKEATLEELLDKMFPPVLKMNPAERRLVLLNMEKRSAILEKQFQKYFDFELAPVRQRILQLFSRVSSLMCSIGCSQLSVEKFPQQELVILSQLFGHIVKMLEEIENVFIRSNLPIDDIMLSMDGMEETFEDIEGSLKQSLDTNIRKSFEFVK